MSDKSAIEWTDATWNPTTDCTKISPGCAHCYIERTPAFRIAGNRFEHGKTEIEIFHDRLAQPLHWRKPRRVFVNSLSDLFHEDIGDAFIDQVFAAMALAPQHTFQVLTKRAERMRAYLFAATRHDAIVRSMDMPPWMPPGTRFPRVPENWPMPNVWLGVSVENQHFANERIPLLLKTPAAVRFISAEPLLEHVHLDNGETSWLTCTPVNQQREGGDCCMTYLEHGDRHFRGIDWVIVGGESGPKARSFDVAWARSIVSECHRQGVPCFVKQLGSRAYGPDTHSAILRDRKGGDPAEWPTDLRVREFPA